MKPKFSSNTTVRRAGTPQELPSGPTTSTARKPAGLRSNLSLPRQVAALAIWPFFEQMLGFLVGFVDTALAGHLSIEATNAVGSATYITWLLYMLVSAVGIGAGALVSRSVGAGRWKRANMVLGQSMTLSICWGCLISAGLYGSAPLIGEWSGLKGESLSLCTLYLRLLSFCAPLNTMLAIANACLRASGDTRSPFLIMILVNVINTGVSLLLVIPQSPWGGHGLRGVAIGTMIAWTVGALSILWVLLKGHSKLCLARGNMRLKMRWISRITRIGLPNLLENILMWSGNFAILALIGRLNLSYAVGAHIVGIRIEAISYLSGLAFGLAGATLAGQYLGAGDPRNARKAILLCLLFGSSIMVAAGIGFMTIPHILILPMTNQQEFLDLTPQLLFHAGWSQLGFAVYIILGSAMRGAGDTRAALIMTFGSTFLVRLPLVYVLAITFDMGLVGVWIGCSIELLIRGGLFLGRFLQGGWAKVSV